MARLSVSGLPIVLTIHDLHFFSDNISSKDKNKVSIHFPRFCLIIDENESSWEMTVMVTSNRVCIFAMNKRCKSNMFQCRRCAHAGRISPGVGHTQHADNGEFTQEWKHWRPANKSVLLLLRYFYSIFGFFLDQSNVCQHCREVVLNDEGEGCRTKSYIELVFPKFIIKPGFAVGADPLCNGVDGSVNTRAQKVVGGRIFESKRKEKTCKYLILKTKNGAKLKFILVDSNHSTPRDQRCDHLCSWWRSQSLPQVQRR